jgi:hypothetical protein
MTVASVFLSPYLIVASDGSMSTLRSTGGFGTVFVWCCPCKTGR